MERELGDVEEERARRGDDGLSKMKEGMESQGDSSGHCDVDGARQGTTFDLRVSWAGAEAEGGTETTIHTPPSMDLG